MAPSGRGVRAAGVVPRGFRRPRGAAALPAPGGWALGGFGALLLVCNPDVVQLGADAVQVGRPALWGLAVDGEAGARRVLELLHEEIALALALLGCPTPADVTRGHVQRARR